MMNDVMKQAVARASKPFLDGVQELLAHEFTAEERLELCGELEAFMTLTLFLLQDFPADGMEGHEVVEHVLDMTSPPMERAVLEKAGSARDATDGRLTRHVHAFFTLASMLMVASGRGKELKEE